MISTNKHLHARNFRQGYGQPLLSKTACGVIADLIDAKATRQTKDVTCLACLASSDIREIQNARSVHYILKK